MSRKKFLFLLVSAIFTVTVLSGCFGKDTAPGKEDGEKQSADNQDAFSPEKYYNLNKDKVLVTVNGKTLTVGDVKKAAFEEYFVPIIDHFIEKQLILEKYPVTEEEVNKKINEYKEMGVTDLNKEEIRFEVAYNKALKNGIKVTEEDLRTIYETYYKDSGMTYEEAKPTIQENAPFYLENNYPQILNEIRKSADIQYFDKALEKEINKLYEDEKVVDQSEG